MIKKEARDAIIPRLSELLGKSHDPHRPVGVVIADNSGHILSEATNMPPQRFHFAPSDTHNAIDNDPTWKYFMMEHAERNAIIEALKRGNSLEGATLYGTLFPCADCARAIVAAGIEEVVVPKPGLHPDRDERWRSHYEYATKVFELGNIHLGYFEEEELDRIYSTGTARQAKS